MRAGHPKTTSALVDCIGLPHAWQRSVWFCLIVLLSAPLSAQEGGKIEWRSDWRRVGVPEYVITPTLFAGAALIKIWIPPVKEALWTKPLWLDMDSRNALRIESRSRRDFFGGMSTAVAYVSIAHPVLFDTLVIATLQRLSMTLIMSPRNRRV